MAKRRNNIRKICIQPKGEVKKGATTMGNVCVANALDLETFATWLRLGRLAHYCGAYDDNFWPVKGIHLQIVGPRPPGSHGFWAPDSGMGS